ncbi:MAG: arginase family protein [Flavobacteriaceae bacterium]
MEEINFISVDFDFFVWNGLESKDDDVKIFLPETGNVTSIPNVYLFDWGHSESWHPDLQSIIWQTRYNEFLRVGIDPIKVCDAHSEKGTVSLDGFFDVLSRRFNLCSSHKFFYADSHAHGYSALRETQSFTGEPVRVVHFDAHADLGYSSDSIKKEKEKNVLDCGSWLWHAIDIGLVESVSVVYPDWRDLNEFTSSNGGWCPPNHICELESEGRVSFTNWSEWLRCGESSSSIDTVFACRSSAWTPPWLDVQAERLFELFSSKEFSLCLDCDNSFPNVGGYDACKRRDFVAEIPPTSSAPA